MQTPRRIRPELAAAAAAGVGFAALARVAALSEPTRLDRIVHDLAVSAYRRPLELAQIPIEIVGLPVVYLPLAALVARRLGRRHRRPRVIVTAAAAGWIALRITRLIYSRTRPPRPPHRAPKRESSFPSGHTTGLTALATTAALVLEREQILSPAIARALLVGVPLVVGFNRIYVREHWLTDVIGGWLLGAGVALTCLGITANGRGRRARRGPIG